MPEPLVLHNSYTPPQRIHQSKRWLQATEEAFRQEIGPAIKVIMKNEHIHHGVLLKHDDNSILLKTASDMKLPLKFDDIRQIENIPLMKLVRIFRTMDMEITHNVIVE